MNSPVSVNSPSCQTLADWLAYIEASHPIDKIELGLERVLTVAERGQLQHLPGIKILIGGTNGKGSSARALEQLLLAQGYRVGVYTSPHLLHFNERLRINDVDASDELWVQGLSEVEALRAEVPLTYFEFTTLAAFAILKQQQVDICLIEVGLGGRLDATNIISPDASILTTVDLDHQDFLGNDRESIGREKAGIFRANGGDCAGESKSAAVSTGTNCSYYNAGPGASSRILVISCLTVAPYGTGIVVSCSYLTYQCRNYRCKISRPV